MERRSEAPLIEARCREEEKRAHRGDKGGLGAGD